MQHKTIVLPDLNFELIARAYQNVLACLPGRPASALTPADQDPNHASRSLVSIFHFT